MFNLKLLRYVQFRVLINVAIVSSYCVLATTAIAKPEKAAIDSASQDPVNQLVYSSEVEAVVAATNYYNPLSLEEDREYMGAIFRHRSLNYYVYTVNAGRQFGSSVTIRIPRRKEYDFVALWHTHGKDDPRHRYFSADDTAAANTVRRPFYLADGSGKLKVFRPDGRTFSMTEARSKGLGSQPGASRGEIVINNQKAVTIATNFEQWLQLNSPSLIAEGQPQQEALSVTASDKDV